MEQRLSVVTLGVRDITKSRQFYEAGLGWRRNAGEDDVAFYQAGGFVVALYAWDKLAEDAHVAPSGVGFRGISLGFCTHSKQKVDDILSAAKAAGGAVIVNSRDTFWGGYAGYFTDLDGHLWEIAWNPGWTLTDKGETLLEKPS